MLFLIGVGSNPTRVKNRDVLFFLFIFFIQLFGMGYDRVIDLFQPIDACRYPFLFTVQVRYDAVLKTKADT